MISRAGAYTIIYKRPAPETEGYGRASVVKRDWLCKTQSLHILYIIPVDTESIVAYIHLATLFYAATISVNALRQRLDCHAF